MAKAKQDLENDKLNSNPKGPMAEALRDVAKKAGITRDLSMLNAKQIGTLLPNVLEMYKIDEGNRAKSKENALKIREAELKKIEEDKKTKWNNSSELRKEINTNQTVKDAIVVDNAYKDLNNALASS